MNIRTLTDSDMPQPQTHTFLFTFCNASQTLGDLTCSSGEYTPTASTSAIFRATAESCDTGTMACKRWKTHSFEWMVILPFYKISMDGKQWIKHVLSFPTAKLDLLCRWVSLFLNCGTGTGQNRSFWKPDKTVDFKQKENSWFCKNERCVVFSMMESFGP